MDGFPAVFGHSAHDKNTLDVFHTLSPLRDKMNMLMIE
jgi:hypothetical protein